MPAWIAGIQVCKDASGDIHVDLDFSPPCWNDGIEGRSIKLSATRSPTFSKEDTRNTKLKIENFPILRGLRVLVVQELSN